MEKSIMSMADEILGGALSNPSKVSPDVLNQHEEAELPELSDAQRDSMISESVNEKLGPELKKHAKHGSTEFGPGGGVKDTAVNMGSADKDKLSPQGKRKLASHRARRAARGDYRSRGQVDRPSMSQEKDWSDEKNRQLRHKFRRGRKTTGQQGEEDRDRINRPLDKATRKYKVLGQQQQREKWRKESEERRRKAGVQKRVEGRSTEIKNKIIEKLRSGSENFRGIGGTKPYGTNTRTDAPPHDAPDAEKKAWKKKNYPNADGGLASHRRAKAIVAANKKKREAAAQQKDSNSAAKPRVEGLSAEEALLRARDILKEIEVRVSKSGFKNAGTKQRTYTGDKAKKLVKAAKKGTEKTRYPGSRGEGSYGPSNSIETDKRTGRVGPDVTVTKGIGKKSKVAAEATTCGAIGVKQGQMAGSANKAYDTDAQPMGKDTPKIASVDKSLRKVGKKTPKKTAKKKSVKKESIDLFLDRILNECQK